MMRLSFSVMAVPSRQDHVTRLVARLEGQIHEARKVYAAWGFDPSAFCEDVAVFYDEARQGPWHGWRGAWETHRAAGSTHHVVLQDDVRISADLPLTLLAIARARPIDVVSGFLPRKSVERAQDLGLKWVSTRRFLWSQCVMMPTETGDRMLSWCDAAEGTERAKDWRQHDDVRIAAFLAEVNRPVFVTVPNLVEHVGDEIGGSTMGHNQLPARRRARVWLGEDGSGAGVRWSDLRAVRE